VVQRNILPPSSKSKNEPNYRQDVSKNSCFFISENGGSIFIQNVGELISDYIMPHPIEFFTVIIVSTLNLTYP
jgi:predicted mannosyl-3-phosphoglycerate phosphatase (HAD superfamily)